jgi:hypothetical protein
LFHPGRIAALLALLVCSPRLDVHLTDTPAGQMLDEYFGRRFLGVFPRSRWWRGVLTVPANHDEYLRGRKRHALRGNLRRAAVAGIRCVDCASASAAVDAMWAIEQCERRAPRTYNDLATATQRWLPLLSAPAMTLLVASKPDGSPLALAAGVIDAEVCLLRLAMASNHEARWALHDHLVRTLIDRGVSYLVADDGPFGALGVPPGVHYFQRLMGYELCHITVGLHGGRLR